MVGPALLRPGLTSMRANTWSAYEGRCGVRTLMPSGLYMDACPSAERPAWVIPSQFAKAPPGPPCCAHPAA